jgi:hypothetical protein
MRSSTTAYFGVSRIKPCVLHNDRHIRFEHRGKVGIPRHGGRFAEIVETQMQRAPRRNGHPIRADRLAIGEKDRNVDMRLVIAGIENARGLVRNQRLLQKRASRRDMPFGNGPAPASDGLHLSPRPGYMVIAWFRRPQENHLTAVWFPQVGSVTELFVGGAAYSWRARRARDMLPERAIAEQSMRDITVIVDFS